MIGLSDASWLFTRGSTSVRLWRAENGDGWRLFLNGPGIEVAVHEFPELTACMKRQADIERRLAAAGFLLAVLSERRRSGGLRGGNGQRRSTDPIVSNDPEDS